PARSGLEVCGGCSSRGPVSEAGVVVNAEAGAGVSAVDERTLAHLWSYDGGTADVWLHPGSGGIFVSAAGEHFAMLDPATGEERWRVALDPGEVQLMFDRLSPDVSLLRSSLQDAAEGRSSVLRRIDLDAGEVLWESPGRSGARWQ